MGKQESQENVLFFPNQCFTQLAAEVEKIPTKVE